MRPNTVELLLTIRNSVGDVCHFQGDMIRVPPFLVDFNTKQALADDIAKLSGKTCQEVVDMLARAMRDEEVVG